VPSGLSHPPGVEQQELLGRAREREQLAALVEGAREGRSSSLVLLGEPGVGKTALLDDALARANGMPVLRATGVESETELPFSGLSQLLLPLTGRVDELPPPQSAALAGALALGPPAPGDPLAVGVATLSLLALGAEDRGLLACVDDAHWMDSASLGALAFAARRFGAEGILLLLAAREDVASPLDAVRLPRLELAGLADAPARELLERTAASLAPGVAAAVLETAQGNPLVLLEIPRTLSEAETMGRQALAEPLRPGAVVERAFLREVDAQPEAVRRGLLVAAAAEHDEADIVRAALGAANATWTDLERAERAGIVSLEHGIRFRHPILRSAVYHSAPAAERRAAHGALADALMTSNDPLRPAWHRALAQATPNEDVAAALAQVGENARSRNAPAAAARALELSAQLTPDAEKGAKRLFAAAESLVLAGCVPRARSLLDRTLGATTDTELQVEIQRLRARTLVGGGDPLQACAVLTAEAARLADGDPARAALMYVEAVYGAMAASRPLEAAKTAEQAYALAHEVGGLALMAAGMSWSESLLLIGEVEAAKAARPRDAELFEQANPLQVPQPGTAASFAAIAGYEEESYRHLARVAATLRSLSAPGLLVFPLGALAHLEFRLGRWNETHVKGQEALDLARAAGLVGFDAFVLTALAHVEAGQGRYDESRQHAAQALEVAKHGTEVAALYALPALVLGALGEGDAEEASRRGDELASFYRGRGYRAPGLSQWHANVIEAYALAGRREDADRLSESFSDEAAATEHPWALAASARCRGILAGEEAFESAFAESLHLHQNVPLVFERARTELALGERRRRARRRTDAREPLQRALSTFESLGADPWTERARAELRACGARPRRRDPRPADELTPHELRVAQVIARGVTNREAAAELFLSPKTVDFHLQQVYRKLDIHSRAELAHRFTRDPSVAL
jgi:DNA-binding CsgD family transcriptional regulator